MEKELDAYNVICKCLKEENKKYGDCGELLLFEKIQEKYPNKNNLYYEIKNILISSTELETEHHYNMDDEDWDHYVVYKFYYDICEFDNLYCTINDGDLMFFDDYQQAIRYSDYLVNYGEEINVNKAKILTKNEIMKSSYRWDYRENNWFYDMLGEEGKVYGTDKAISYTYEGDDFNEIDIDEIMENTL